MILLFSKQEKNETIERNESNIKEINESFELNKKTVAMLEEEITAKEKTKNILEAERETLKMQLDSQKDIRIQYRLALQSKRSKQTEGEKYRQQISEASDDIVKLTIQVNELLAEKEAISSDFFSVLTETMESFSKMAKKYPKLDKIVSSSQNPKWSQLIDKINKNFGNSQIPASIVLENGRELSNTFISMVQEHILVLIDVNSEAHDVGTYELKQQYDSKQAELDKLQHELATIKADFKKMTTTFDENRTRHAIRVRELDEQINSLQTRVQEFPNSNSYIELVRINQDLKAQITEQETKNSMKVKENEQTVKQKKNEINQTTTKLYEQMKSLLALFRKKNGELKHDIEEMIEFAQNNNCK